jgi:sterol desaturase/sphingolipid hydroxylase (fatty acid hydroxylase superfamily)
MRLSRIGYYADFYVYPALLISLAGAALWGADVSDATKWISTFLLCLALWTLVEYLMHRFILHHVPYIREMHDDHHVNELEPIGTPTYLSLSLHGLLVFFPALLVSDFAMASAASCGLMLGYLWYISVHHVLHHWHPAHSGYVYSLKRRHALHHHFDGTTNFGVTTSFWDQIFGTLRR